MLGGTNPTLVVSKVESLSGSGTNELDNERVRGVNSESVSVRSSDL